VVLGPFPSIPKEVEVEVSSSERSYIYATSMGVATMLSDGIIK